MFVKSVPHLNITTYTPIIIIILIQHKDSKCKDHCEITGDYNISKKYSLTLFYWILNTDRTKLYNLDFNILSKTII